MSLKDNHEKIKYVLINVTFVKRTSLQDTEPKNYRIVILKIMYHEKRRASSINLVI